MVVSVATVAFEEIEGKAVDKQVQILPGSLQHRRALGDKAVTESRERVRSALVASGLAMPDYCEPRAGRHAEIEQPLRPAGGARRHGGDRRHDGRCARELALDGTLTPLAGVLPAAVAANARGHGLICPES
jgi:magnesium chelatase family protein